MNTDGIAYKKGVHEFDCGACPECLRKRSSVWVLRSVMEAKAHKFNCMLTLTYDNFIRDEKGKIKKDSNGVPLETKVNPDLKVNQRDVQLFIKRLRRWWSSISNEPIKFIACAEYGSRTHRAHYHLLLFGVRFPDYHYYKKSKRGNPIYRSAILDKLWNHGICTIDSVDVHSSVAMYCTKYCAKSRSLDTFMLFSQSIGYEYLMKRFNGLYYMIEGRQYTVPRFVWEKYIMAKYRDIYGDSISPKYVNRSDKSLSDGSFERSKRLREGYRAVRDADPIYVKYLEFWQNLGKQFDQHKIPVRTRILQLPDGKFHNYKNASLRCLDLKKENDIFIPSPGSRAGFGYFERSVEEWQPYRHIGLKVDPNFWLTDQQKALLRERELKRAGVQLPNATCPNTATDTARAKWRALNLRQKALAEINCQNLPKKLTSHCRVGGYQFGEESFLELKLRIESSLRYFSL